MLHFKVRNNTFERETEQTRWLVDIEGVFCCLHFIALHSILQKNNSACPEARCAVPPNFSTFQIFVKEQLIAEVFEGLTRVSAISISSLLLTPVKYPY